MGRVRIRSFHREDAKSAKGREARNTGILFTFNPSLFLDFFALFASSR